MFPFITQVPNPYAVTTLSGRSNLYVGSTIPHTMYTAAQHSIAPVIIRIAGSMHNDANTIFPFFRTALAGFCGVLMSGGTRVIENGQIAASVCEVVADIGLINKNIITMGSFPRFGILHLCQDGHLALDDEEISFPNPGTEYVSCIQLGSEPEDDLHTDGDLPAYFFFLNSLRESLRFRTALIVWAGGRTTTKEAVGAHEENIDVYIVSGSGKAADQQLSRDNFSGQNIFHVSHKEPFVLQQLLHQRRLI